MHTIATRSTARVEIERLALLMAIQDQAQITMAEDNPPTHESMWTAARDFLKALQQLWRDRCGAELPYQLVVVHRQQLARLIHAAGDIEWCYNLAGRFLVIGFLREAQLGQSWRLPWFVWHHARF